MIRAAQVDHFDLDRDETDDCQLVGLGLEAARKWCADRGLALRPMIQDGQQRCGTTDLKIDRVNVETRHGKVARIIGRG